MKHDQEQMRNPAVTADDVFEITRRGQQRWVSALHRVYAASMIRSGRLGSMVDDSALLVVWGQKIQPAQVLYHAEAIFGYDASVPLGGVRTDEAGPFTAPVIGSGRVRNRLTRRPCPCRRPAQIIAVYRSRLTRIWPSRCDTLRCWRLDFPLETSLPLGGFWSPSISAVEPARVANHRNEIRH